MAPGAGETGGVVESASEHGRIENLARLDEQRVTVPGALVLACQQLGPEETCRVGRNIDRLRGDGECSSVIGQVADLEVGQALFAHPCRCAEGESAGPRRGHEST